MAEHNDLGKWGEDQAARYLERQGYVIVERDWKLGHRDIDIIALDGDELAFVEVKTRRNDLFMSPEMAVDWKKRRSLSIAANAYIKMKLIDNPVRFDVITILGTSDDKCTIDHIKGAFLPPTIIR
jgi:putative endonuclease